MIHEDMLLALLDSKEAEQQAREEWMAQWAADNRLNLIRSRLDTTSDTLAAQVNHEQAQRLCQAFAQILLEDSHALLAPLLNELIDAALLDLAADAWSNHRAQLEDGMSEEAWERYQQRSAA